MKKLSTLVCIVMMMSILAIPALAGAEGAFAETKAALKIEKASPEAGTEGVAVDNFSVKIYFNKDVVPKNNKDRKYNDKQVKLTNSKGEKIPTKVYYSDEETGLALVAADNFDKKDKKIQGNEKYTLKLSKNFRAADGSTLGQAEELKYKTLNQQRSTAVYMILMVVMMGGMIFFTVRSTKKAAEKESEKSPKEHVNPYREAKKTGKSVEEIVEKENKKKQKKEAEEAKQREYREQLEAEILEKMRKESNKRVSAPKSISSVGSTYKVTVVNSEGEKLEPKESVAANYKGAKATNKTVKKKGGKKKSKK